MAVHLAVAGDVFDVVLCCDVLFPHEMSWMRSGIKLRIFLLLLFSLGALDYVSSLPVPVGDKLETMYSSTSVALQWLKQLWNHENMYEKEEVRANESYHSAK